MSLRRVWSRQWFRVTKVSSIVNTLLLMVTLALTIWRSIEWRGWSIYAAVPLIVLVLAVGVVAFANLWVVVMRMHVTDRAASMLHDPAQVYAFTPWEQTVWLERDLPFWQHLIDACSQQGHDVTAWQARLDQLQRWARLGYVPMDEAPPHVRMHYMGTKGAPI